MYTIRFFSDKNGKSSGEILIWAFSFASDKKHPTYLSVKYLRYLSVRHLLKGMQKYCFIDIWSKETWPAGWEEWFCPSALVRPHLSAAFSPRVLSTGRMTSWTIPEKGHQNDQRDWALLLLREDERIEGVQPGEKKASLRLNCSLPVPE